MKNKLLAIGIILGIMLMVNSIALAMTTDEIRALCNSDDYEFISQYLDENVNYQVIYQSSFKSNDEIMLDSYLSGPNGEKFFILVTNDGRAVLIKL